MDLGSLGSCFAEPVVTGVIFPEGATCDIINSDMLSRVFPRAPEDRLAAIAKEIDLQIKTGKLDSPERLAHFFGQVRQEIGGKARLVEILDYDVKRLLKTFPYFRRNSAEAQLYGRTAGHSADQQAIANRVYARRIGNGDIPSGDGWRYRGRGLKQLTGRGNYRDFTRRHNALFGGDVNIEDNPGLLAEPKYAVRSALYFWVANKLYLHADRGVSESVANATTRVINRYTDSGPARWEHVKDFHQREVFANTCRFSVAKPRFADQ